MFLVVYLVCSVSYCVCVLDGGFWGKVYVIGYVYYW